MHRTPRSASVAPRGLRIFVCLLLVAAFTPVFTATAVDPLPLPPTPGTYYVDVATGDDANTGGESDPFKSISKAADVSYSGSTIIVAPGTYTSSETTSSGESFPIWIPPGVTLKSSGGPGVTIVDPENDDQAFVVDPCGPGQEAQTVPMSLPPVMAPVTIEGLTIEHGFTKGRGGGIAALYSTLTLRNMVIADCAAFKGGGLFSLGSTVTVESSLIMSNGYDPYAEEPSMEPDSSEDDQRWWGAYTKFGGGAFFRQSVVKITSSMFTENGCLVRGAGIQARATKMEVSGTDFIANVITAEEVRLRSETQTDGITEGYGDGITTAVDTDRGEFEGYTGGGINSNVGSDLDVEDCSFQYNCAPWGGGVHVDGYSVGEVTLSEFTGNYSVGGAGVAQLGEWGDTLEPGGPSSLQDFEEATEAEKVMFPDMAELYVDQCVFEDHEADFMATFLSSWDTSVTIQNSLFDNNMTPFTTVNFGFERFLVVAEASVVTDDLPEPPKFPTKTVMNCTFADNGSLNSVLADVPEAAVINCISWGNEDMDGWMLPVEPPPIDLPQEVNGAYPWEYSVWGAEVWNSDLEYDYMSAFAADPWGNISEDPLFLAPEVRDYRLSPPSPCTDTATSTAAPAYDLPGTFRPQDGDNDGEALWDMGAYEAIYSGTLRTGGETRYGTSVKAVQEYYDEADVVVLARGDLFADGLAASGLCGVYDAPLLLTLPGELPYQTKDEIVRLGASKAYIMGGTGAISDDVKAELEAMGLMVERIGGYDRYATAALIAEEIISQIGTPTATFIARGDLFADALTVSPVAYGIKSPILLVRTGDLPDATIDVLGDINSDTVVIAGGSGAVSLSVEKGIESVTVAADRIDGADRYETSVAFSEYAIAQGWAKWMTTGLATGVNFPDALTGGPAIGVDHGVLILTPGETLHASVETALSDNKAFISRLDIFGGNGAISDSVMAAAEDAIK